MATQVHAKDITLSGTIIATDIDRRGKAVEIALETEDFQQYVIENNGKGGDLFEFIFDDVSITGTLIGKTVEGVPVLRVKTFHVKNANGESSE